MCGACPGGGRLSEATIRLAQLLPPARTALLVSELTGDRLRISVLGDGWSVGLPTGGMSIASDVEGLVHHCAPYVRAERRAAVEARLRGRPDAGVAALLEYFPPS